MAYVNIMNPTAGRTCECPQVLVGDALLPILDQTHEFENGTFGPDFTCEFHELAHWYSSRNYIPAAVATLSKGGEPAIHAMGSLLITSSEDQQGLLQGRLRDCELRPWLPNRGMPSLYLASIISDSAENLRTVYGALCRAAKARLSQIPQVPSNGFAIAGGGSGLRHLSKLGFVQTSTLYRGRYPVMIISNETANAQFWKELLSPKANHENA